MSLSKTKLGGFKVELLVVESVTVDVVGAAKSACTGVASVRTDTVS